VTLSRLPGFGSLRARLVMLLVAGVILPLTAIGWWTTRTAVRSGRSLLQSQLDSALAQAVSDLEHRWTLQQADLLLLAENEPTRRLLVDTAIADGRPSPFVERAFAQISNVEYVVLRDARGRVRWTLGTPRGAAVRAAEAGMLRERQVETRIPVGDVTRGDTIGSVEARINAATLLPSIGSAASHNGPLSALKTSAGDLIVPPGAEESIFTSGVDGSGRRWLVSRQRVAPPGLDILIAGALDPIVVPFEHAANTALIALIVAALLVTVVVLVGGRMITAELERAVVAAEAVAAGDLTRQLPARSGDEVGRLASAFNAMTESLRRTLDELTRKEALAAVGEFASELAHEVRNPLTSMRLDLQRAEEEADDSRAVRAVIPRLLRQVERLDRAVGGALRVARGNRVSDRGVVDLVEVLRGAMASARPEFDRRAATIELRAEPGTSYRIQGDAMALEQVFLNLLVNAAHALGDRGTTVITVLEATGAVTIVVADSGVGMTPEALARAGDGYHSSKRDGTGLGLKIARRIVTAHGGQLEIESVPGLGTRVTVTLPKSPESAAAVLQ
jgi:two-component system sensor histidine kinase AtoS